MYNDGKCYLWIPSVLTLNRVNSASAAIINAVHVRLGYPQVAVGQTNPYYLDLNDLDMGGASFTRDVEPGLAVCGPINNTGYLTVEYVKLIVEFGAEAASLLSIAPGDVEGLDVFFELESVTAEVPESFPNRSYTTGLGDETVSHVHTWETWGLSDDGRGHAPKLIGGKYYRPSTYGQSGRKLLASQWCKAGLTVKTVSEYSAVALANAPFPR
jgi:hypothetical protein